jgi:hypothetical protein
MGAARVTLGCCWSIRIERNDNRVCSCKTKFDPNSSFLQYKGAPGDELNFTIKRHDCYVQILHTTQKIITVTRQDWAIPTQ